MGDFLKSSFGKMFMELLARHREKTSEQSLKLSGKSARETIAFLDMRKTNKDGKNGRTPDLSWEIIPLSLGEDLMHKVGEFPKDASVSSLSSILEVNVPDRYYLSVRACEGILRRSEQRGKQLDPLLKQALLNTIAYSQLKATLKTAELSSAEMVSYKPSQDEWEQGGGNVPIAVFSFDSLASNSMKSANPHSGSRRVDIAKTLDCADQSPAKNQGGLCVIQAQAFGQASYDEYALTEQAVTLKATGGNYGGGSENLVLVPCEGDVGIANGGAGKKAGSIAFSKEVSPTLKAGASGLQAPVVSIPYTLKIRSGCEGGGKGALVQKDKSATLSCNNDQTLFVPTQTENGEVIYLARKLTPTECASLQGFEKDWCALVPHKDSAEYKMWGNGMAFPCMLYIMEGVQEVLAERYLDNLFGGDTAEP